MSKDNTESSWFSRLMTSFKNVPKLIETDIVKADELVVLENVPLAIVVSDGDLSVDEETGTAGLGRIHVKYLDGVVFGGPYGFVRKTDHCMEHEYMEGLHSVLMLKDGYGGKPSFLKYDVKGWRVHNNRLIATVVIRINDKPDMVKTLNNDRPREVLCTTTIGGGGHGRYGKMPHRILINVMTFVHSVPSESTVRIMHM